MATPTRTETPVPCSVWPDPVRRAGAPRGAGRRCRRRARPRPGQRRAQEWSRRPGAEELRDALCGRDGHDRQLRPLVCDRQRDERREPFGDRLSPADPASPSYSTAVVFTHAVPPNVQIESTIRSTRSFQSSSAVTSTFAPPGSVDPDRRIGGVLVDDVLASCRPSRGPRHE